MADNINILIRAILEKSTKAQLETELRNIEQKLKPVNLKTNIDKISQQFKTLANGTEKLVKTTTDTTNQYGQQVRIIEKIDKNTKKLVTDTRIVTQNYKAQRIEVEKIANAYNTQFFKNFNTSIGINSVTKSAKDSASVFEDLFNKTTKSTLGLTAIEKQTVKLNPALKEATKNTGLFGQSLLDAGKKFAGWLLIGNVIMSVVRQVRFGINTIVELDSAMVSLRKVTEETEESYREFYITSGEVARQLGRTKQAVINSAAEFARLGFNIKESLTLAREAMILSNVGEVSIGDATTSLISTIKGFGIAVDEEGKNIRKIIDIYNEVANNYAISQEGIAESLRKSASSLYNAGNTLEESVAMLTAANAVVQNPDMVGTAMKTVTMRLRGITDEGEEVQDLLPKLESEFNKLGITIRKNADTFKSTYDIFDSLASKWDELTDFQRANILELIAGKRQGNIISSMLGNWEDAQDSLTTALTSGGSAMREFIKYMDSIEYKSGVLQSSLTNLWSKALSSGALKGIIDAGIRFVETIDVMVNHTDYLSAVILPGFVSVLLLKVVPALITSIGAMKTATTAAAMMNAAINPLLAVVTLATVGFGLYSSTVAHAERQKREYIETTERELELAESEGKAVNVLAEQYDKLEDKVGETEEGKKKLDKIISHLIKINPDLKQGIDGQKLSYDNLGTAIQRTIDKMNELQRASRAALMEAYKAELKGIYDAREIAERNLKIAQERMSSSGYIVSNVAKYQIEGYKSQLNKLNEEAREIGKKIQSLYAPFTSPSGVDPDDEGNYRIPPDDNTGGSPYSSKLTLSYRDLQIAIENVSFELDKLKEKEKSLSGSDLINNLSQQNELINKRIKLLEELNWRYGEDLPRLKTQLLELGFEYETMEAQASKYNKLSDKQKEKVDNLVKSIDDLTDSYMKNSLEILQNKNDLYSLAEAVKKVNEEIKKAEKDRLDNLSSVEEELVKIRKHNLNKKLDALEESHKKELDLLKERHDKTIQSYDDDLKEFERYINEKLGLLEDQYAEEDFLKQLTKEREKANEIQRQINELSLDDSLEARTRVVELTQELADQEEVINKLKNERERNLRKDNLNQQLDDYKDYIKELKNRENNRYEHRVSSLEREYKKHKETLEKELTNERLYAEARRQLTEDNLDDIIDLFDKFHKETGKGWSLLGDTIKNEFIDKLIDAKSALEDLNNINIGGKFPKGGSSGGGSVSQSEIERIAREHNVDMGVAKDMAKTNERLGYKKYHEGGFIGGKALDPRHEEIAKMLKGELVLTPIDLNNFGKNLLNFLPKVTIPQLSTSSSGTTIDASININGNVDGRFKPQLIQAQDNQIRKIMNIVSKNGSVTTIKRK